MKKIKKYVKYLKNIIISVITYKYHNPINWHMSGQSEYHTFLPRKPLSWENETHKDWQQDNIIDFICITHLNDGFH